MAEPLTAREAAWVAAAKAAVAPMLGELDAIRQRCLGRLRRILLIGAVATAVATVVVLLTEAIAGIAFLVPILGLAATAFVAALAARAYKAPGKTAVIASVCGAIGELDYQPRPTDFDLRPFVALGVIPAFDVAKVEDGFTGRHRGTAFRMVELRLRNRRGPGGAKLPFRGVLFELSVPVPVAATVMIGPDLPQNIPGELQPPPIAHPAFARLYKVLADDPAGAAALLTPGFLDAMVTLAERRAGKALRGAFADERFRLALPLERNLFEPVALFSPAALITERIPTLVRDITIAHRLIDILHGDRPPAPGAAAPRQGSKQP